MKSKLLPFLFLATGCATNLKVLTQDSSWKEYMTPASMGSVSFPQCMASDSALHVFGGFREGASTASNSQGYSFDFVSVRWKKWPEEKGPTPRQGTAATLTKKGIFVFGGEGENHALSNDAQLFDTESMTWQTLPKAKGLVPRSRATATAVGDAVIVFGGKGPGTLDAGLFDLSTMKWSTLPPAQGLKARLSHVAIANGDNFIIWGGFQDGKRRNDGFLFDSKKRVWTALPATNLLSPRANAKATTAGSLVYILGGTTDQGPAKDGAIFDLQTREWKTLPGIPHEGYERLSGFELVAIKDLGLFLSGGRHADASFNKQAFLFDFKEEAWRKVQALNPPPGSIAHCVSVNPQGTVFVLGGLGNKNSSEQLTQFSGLWFLPLE